MQTSTRNWGFKKTLKNIYSNGGIGRFWKGWFLIGSASVPAHSLYFSIYEIMKEKLGVERSVNLNLYSFNLILKGFQFIASGLTGACATLFHDLILTPADSKYKVKYSDKAKNSIIWLK